MGPYNLRREPLEEKIARIDDIGGPDTHSNFPLGWAMAANTPLRRYKQNTHGGGIRDPLVISWPKGLAARGELRPQFCHASDLVPTLLDLVGVKPPGRSTASRRCRSKATSFAARHQGSRGAVEDSAAVFRDVRPSRPLAGRLEGRGVPSAGHAFDRTSGSCSISTATSARPTTSPRSEPERLKAMIDEWWSRPRRTRCCRSTTASRRASPTMPGASTARASSFVFHAGMGHVPTDVAPDVRSRSYTIEADARIDGAATEGVLIAHGDMTCGYGSTSRTAG